MFVITLSQSVRLSVCLSVFFYLCLSFSVWLCYFLKYRRRLVAERRLGTFCKSVYIINLIFDRLEFYWCFKNSFGPLCVENIYIFQILRSQKIISYRFFELEFLTELPLRQNKTIMIWVRLVPIACGIFQLWAFADALNGNGYQVILHDYWHLIIHIQAV